MERAIIFANGQMQGLSQSIEGLMKSSLIVAADGGTHHCMSLGIKPDVIIGDFDSLEAQAVDSNKQAGVEIIQFPSRKNETDLELALIYCIDHGIKEAYIFAALGDRWDMSIANLLLAAHPSFSTLDIHFLDGSMELVPVRGGQQVDIFSKPGKPLSLIPLAGDVIGITTSGLEYPLQDETLYLGSSRGISNVFLQDDVRIQVRQGILLCIYERVDNYPETKAKGVT